LWFSQPEIEEQQDEKVVFLRNNEEVLDLSYKDDELDLSGTNAQWDARRPGFSFLKYAKMQWSKREKET
jgi:hypothetical protein